MTVTARSVSITDQHIGERLANLRKTLNLTLQELAGRLSITHQQLQKYEKGVNRISVSRLLEIAHVLNVPVNYFLDGLNGQSPKEEAERKMLCMRIMSNYHKIQDATQREAVAQLIETLAAQ